MNKLTPEKQKEILDKIIGTKLELSTEPEEVVEINDFNQKSPFGDITIKTSSNPFGITQKEGFFSKLRKHIKKK